MGVTHREQGTVDGDRKVQGRAGPGTPVIDIPTGVGRRYRVHHFGFRRGEPQEAEMHPEGYSDAFERCEVPLRGGVIHDDTRVVDRLVDYAERVGLRRPAESVDRPGPVA